MRRASFRRFRHPDQLRYIVFVLWLIGYSQRSIAHVTKLRTKQVAGIINKSEFQDRAAIGDEVRAAALRELEESRYVDGTPVDGGFLDGVYPFRARSLDGRQARGPLARKIDRRAS